MLNLNSDELNVITVHLERAAKFVSMLQRMVSIHEEYRALIESEVPVSVADAVQPVQQESLITQPTSPAVTELNPVASVSTPEPAPTTTATTPAKKRGRPRIKPIKEPVAVTGRKRGRPRKVKVEETIVPDAVVENKPVEAPAIIVEAKPKDAPAPVAKAKPAVTAPAPKTTKKKAGVAKKVVAPKTLVAKSEKIVATDEAIKVPPRHFDEPTDEVSTIYLGRDFLQAMVDNGGSGVRKDLVTTVGELNEKRFQPKDIEKSKKPGLLRWQARLYRIMERMQTSGYINKGKELGVWDITPSGLKRLEVLKLQAIEVFGSNE